jgi:hypothetical protein
MVRYLILITVGSLELPNTKAWIVQCKAKSRFKSERAKESPPSPSPSPQRWINFKVAKRSTESASSKGRKKQAEDLVRQSIPI